MAETMEPAKAAEVLKTALGNHKGNLTVADAAAKAGLSLRDAERGLHQLTTEYPGEISATENGELLFKFPNGFSRPLFTRPGWVRFWDKARKVALGVGKFAVRAWISVVLIGYVAVFLALAIALAVASSQGNSDNRRSGAGFGIVQVLLRVVFEALWWTFHPFSPFATHNIYGGGLYGDPRRRVVQQQKKEPFYARVNRFVFGPEPAPVDPREIERRLIAQIRTSQGRIGMADVLRVTGLPRQEADALLARLMLDYDGEVEVSDNAGVFYKFPALRKTAGEAYTAPPPPAWSTKAPAPQLTGNDAGSNVLIAGLNAFNLFMSFVAIQGGLTIERISAIVKGLPVEMWPPSGFPVVLGAIPLVFSTLLFALPIWRAITHGAKKRAVAKENARKNLLQVVLDGVKQGGVDESKLKRAWKEAAGDEPSDKELVREVVKLGGDIDMDAGRAQYRFRDLEAEVEALKKERAQASDQEKEVGAVVYSSGS